MQLELSERKLEFCADNVCLLERDISCDNDSIASPFTKEVVENANLYIGPWPTVRINCELLSDNELECSLSVAKEDINMVRVTSGCAEILRTIHPYIQAVSHIIDSCNTVGLVTTTSISLPSLRILVLDNQLRAQLPLISLHFDQISLTSVSKDFLFDSVEADIQWAVSCFDYSQDLFQPLLESSSLQAKVFSVSFFLSVASLSISLSLYLSIYIASCVYHIFSFCFFGRFACLLIYRLGVTCSLLKVSQMKAKTRAKCTPFRPWL